jgi:hypothetical protein
MSGWNGTGTFTRARNWQVDEAAGETMDSDLFDEEDDNFEGGINACVAKNGENAFTGNANLGGYTATNAGSATARTHLPTLGQVVDAAHVYGTSGGAANVQTLALTPSLTAYAAGQMFVFKAGFTNTAAATFNVDSVGAKNIFIDGAALNGGEIVANRVYVLVYDGTQFQLITSTGLPVAHACHVYASSSVAFPNAGSTDLDCDTEIFDTDTLHDVGSNTDRITVPSWLYGIWRFTAMISLNPAASANGPATLRIATTLGNDIATWYWEFENTDSKVAALTGLWEMDAAEPWAHIHMVNACGQTITTQVTQFCAEFIGTN